MLSREKSQFFPLTNAGGIIPATELLAQTFQRIKKYHSNRGTAVVVLFLSLLKPLPARWEQKTWGTTEGPGRLLPAARLRRTPAAPQGPQDTGLSRRQSYELRAASCLEAVRKGCRSGSPFALPARSRQRWPATNPGRPEEPRRQVCKLQPPLLLPPAQSDRVPRETPKKTPKQNPQTCTFISFWLQHARFYFRR